MLENFLEVTLLL